MQIRHTVGNKLGRSVPGMMLIVSLVSVVVGGMKQQAEVSAAPPVQHHVIVGAQEPVTGTLDKTLAHASYEFECYEDGVASVYVETTSGDLEVELTVLDPSAEPLAQGQSQTRDEQIITVAEAFVAPEDGSCTVQLTGAAGTSGTYELRVLPGYAQLDKWDAFEGAGPPLEMTWPVLFSNALDIAVREQHLDMQVMLNGTYGLVLPDDEGLNWSDVYMQADFVIDGDPSYYEYGFLLRADSAQTTFYLLTVSSDGDWSCYYYDGDWYELQGWTVHPAIDATDKEPTLGVWLRDHTITLYFNGHYVGEVSDPNRFKKDGLMGVVVATRSSQYDILQTHVDNLVITRPF